MDDSPAAAAITDEALSELHPRHWRLARFIIGQCDRLLRHHNHHLARLIERLEEIQERIMTTQADLDTAVASINSSLDAIEQEIRDLQAANPALDLSGLQGIVDRTRADVPAPPA